MTEDQITATTDAASEAAFDPQRRATELAILDALRANPFIEFHRLFDPEEGRMGVVVSFLALMELTREQLVDMVQNEPFGQIYVKAPE